jgi:hypothetical protein
VDCPATFRCRRVYRRAAVRHRKVSRTRLFGDPFYDPGVSLFAGTSDRYDQLHVVSYCWQPVVHAVLAPLEGEMKIPQGPAMRSTMRTVTKLALSCYPQLWDHFKA